MVERHDLEVRPRVGLASDFDHLRRNVDAEIVDTSAQEIRYILTPAAADIEYSLATKMAQEEGHVDLVLEDFPGLPDFAFGHFVGVVAAELLGHLEVHGSCFHEISFVDEERDEEPSVR